MTLTFSPTLMQRFHSKVDKRGPDECWPWTGATNPRGYGEVYVGDAGHRKPRKWLAHRVAWWASHGTPPEEGTLVRHACDNPPCCNPRHLLLGTHSDNNADMLARGREHYPKGSEHYNYRVSPETRALIRERHAKGERQIDIATDLHVSRAHVSRITRGLNR